MFLEAPLSIYDRRFASAPVVSLLPRVDPPSSRSEPSARPRPCRYDFEQLGCRRCHFPIRLREEEIEGGATGEDSSSLHSERKKRTEGKGSGEDSLSRTIRRKITPLPEGPNGRGRHARFQVTRDGAFVYG